MGVSGKITPVRFCIWSRGAFGAVDAKGKWGVRWVGGVGGTIQMVKKKQKQRKILLLLPSDYMLFFASLHDVFSKIF